MDCGTVPENVAVGVESETFYDAKDWEEEIKELEDKVKHGKRAISESKRENNVGRMKQRHCEK